MSDNNFQKLLKKEFIILKLLIANGEMFGLELVEASEGELRRGTTYIILQRMSDEGYVESREEPRQTPEIGLPRRKYWVTGLGERVYQNTIKAEAFIIFDFIVNKGLMKG